MLTKKLLNHAKSVSGSKQPRITAPLIASVMKMSIHPGYEFETLKVTSPANKVLNVEMNRPEKRNAMNKQFFHDLHNCFDQIGSDGNVRAVVLSGAGKIFSAGLDLMSFASSLMPREDEDPSRRALQIRIMVKTLQDSITKIEKIPQPVIAAVHSGCVGGGVDLICTCDIRLASKDAYIQIKEVDVGLAADIGTLQRMPKIIGNSSLLRELSYTARAMGTEEGKSFGLFSHVYEDREETLSKAIEMAALIAEKSPVAVYGTKTNLNYARDHSVDENLEYITTWNTAMLQSQDLMKSAQAMMMKEPAEYDDLPLSKL